MPPADILSRIRQGDPNVLTSILNHSLRPYGVRAQVVHRENCLHVLLESEQPPDFQVWVPMLQRVMRHLGIQAVSTVKVYGHQADDPTVAWKREFTLASPNSDSLIHALSSVAPPEAIRTMGGNAAVRVDEVFVADDRDAAIAPVPLFATEPGTASTDQSSPAVLNTAEIGEVMENDAQISSTEFDQIFPSLDNVDLFQSPELPMPDTTDLTVPEAAPSLDLETPFAADAELLKRPESVVLVLFVTLLMFWQLYLELAEGPDSNSLTTGKLADRLGVDRSTIRRRKYREDFAEWSRSRDPEGVAWMAWGSRFLPLD